MWWQVIICGVIAILLATVFYGMRGKWHVRYEGGSPKTVTIWSIVIGTVSIIVGIAAYFFPNFELFLKQYSETSESVSSGWEALGFLFWQLVLIFGVIHSLVYRLANGENSKYLPAVLFFGGVSSIYWIWIWWSGNFDKAFKAPFRYLYNLFF